jgi:hypothetical protein
MKAALPSKPDPIIEQKFVFVKEIRKILRFGLGVVTLGAAPIIALLEAT